MSEFFDISLCLSQSSLDGGSFEAVVVKDNCVRGYLQIKSAVEKIVQITKQSLKRIPQKNVNAEVKRAKPQLPPKPKVETHAKSLSHEGTPLCVASLNANDMIKIMQDFETKKKTYCCVVCKYESVHSTTIKRHVETKHMPQTVTLNCLQCPKSFKLKQVLKKHYMDVHGLLEPAAKAMLPA